METAVVDSSKGALDFSMLSSEPPAMVPRESACECWCRGDRPEGKTACCARASPPPTTFRDSTEPI